MILLKTYMFRIQRINDLIKMRATGTPNELAEKLDISERRVYQLIEFMKKEFNAPILYSEVRQSYIYNCNGEIKLNWAEFSNNEILYDR